MIAIPVTAAHSTTSKDSLGAPVVMSGAEEWPSLGGPGSPANVPSDDWEMLSPTVSGEVKAVLPPAPEPCHLTRKNSISAPDLRELDDEPAAKSNPWGAKNKVSFRDAILSTSKEIPEEPTTISPKARVKDKVKPRYVVTPIKRCAKSTGDLLALAAEDEDEEEPMGASDAQEYYERKAHGAHGRSNGLKQRPDEAKRKQMIVQKKNAQRQQGRV